MWCSVCFEPIMAQADILDHAKTTHMNLDQKDVTVTTNRIPKVVYTRFMNCWIELQQCKLKEMSNSLEYFPESPNMNTEETATVAKNLGKLFDEEPKKEDKPQDPTGGDESPTTPITKKPKKSKKNKKQKIN